MARAADRGAAERGRAAPAAPFPGEAVLIAFAWALVAAMVVRLGFAAAGGVFASDECFHVAASARVLELRGLPVDFPEFYSGYFYFHPPLFHVLGALWIATFGTAGLHLLPTAIYAAMLALVGLGGRRLAPAGALAATALIFAIHPSFQLHAAKLYVEGLSALLSLAMAMALVAWWRKPGMTRAVWIGVAIGLGVLAKYTALLPFGMLGAAALVAARPGSQRPARQLVIAAAIGVALALPGLIRNQILYGAALYPSGAPDIDHELMARSLAKFSTPPAQFYAGLPRAFGPVLGAGVLAALAASAWRRRFGIWEATLVFALAALLISPLVPYIQTRHLLPFFAVAALASMAMLFEAFADRPALRAALLALLVVPGLLAHTLFENPRPESDLPEYLATAFQKIKPLLHHDDLVLSLWTYDTAYYTGARATWPNPWGQRRHPIAMFHETDPKKFVAELREQNIDYVLMSAEVAAKEFDSANYPLSFVNCVNDNLRAGRLTTVWMSHDVLFIRVPPA